MPKYSVCVPVIGQSLEELLNNLEIAQKAHDFLELRVDYIQDLKVEDLQILKAKCRVKAILTARMEQYGGKLPNDKLLWQSLVLAAAELEFAYIDIDYQEGLKEKDLLIKIGAKTKIILSYHNFQEIPSYRKLRTIYKQMKSRPHEILKFACHTQNPDALQDLYHLLINKAKGEKLVVIGMGQLGRSSRFVGPLLGSEFTFAAFPNQISAAGQPTIEELERFYSVLAT